MLKKAYHRLIDVADVRIFYRYWREIDLSNTFVLLAKLLHDLLALFVIHSTGGNATMKLMESAFGKEIKSLSGTLRASPLI